MALNRSLQLFYYLKPMIPRGLQLHLRRSITLRKARKFRTIWPIDERAGHSPAGWTGWPCGKQFALVLTHDVESAFGCKTCYKLCEIEFKLGFRSSFYFVPKRYDVPEKMRKLLEIGGFEVGVHGLKHDGRLFASKEIFQERAIQINDCLKKWKAVGFRSPSMHHNLEWITDLDIEYDSSTFDTDPFEPQSDAVGTIFPFFVQGSSGRPGYIEMPYTLPQDFTLFVVMNQRNISIWIEKLKWISQMGGMALINTHPDYMSFGKNSCVKSYPATYYRDFLLHIKKEYEDRYWHVLPRELARYWTSFVGQNASKKLKSNEKLSKFFRS